MFPIAALYRSPSFLHQTHRKSHAFFNYSFQWDSQPFKTDSGLYVFFWQSSWVSIFLSMLYTYLFYWGWLWEAKQWSHNRTKNENDSQRQKIVENLLEKKILLEIKKSWLGGWLHCWECLLLKCIWTWIQMFSTLIKKLRTTLQGFNSGVVGGEGCAQTRGSLGCADSQSSI